MKSSLTLEHQICFQLYTASKELTRLYRPILAPLNLTYSQYLVMLVLWEEDGIDMKQLGERLTLDSGTLSPLVKRLMQIGYVEKVRAQDDERRIVLTLTDSGRALREQAEDVPRQVSGMLKI
ncbi:MAG: MarR family transcriptional regulator, partial [Exiguobacterium sp.]|nr:MarR family transcriptional regulator [Exiguobacterium sp.]MDX5424692.1 MarR family transcriptional regulator [Exiguobacterium sp.]MDX6772167.1 MarR family transcriptional regulator [Exiguobacterium sp.]